ncbi:hypothetical protein CASFOL_032397 [Castilleja foliolosa]|uniref:Subtilisin-like protease n=1 Tax=Castilleja foliolosa TaxID=1961234 RepID=A0ABD3C2H3_9LAMI
MDLDQIPASHTTQETWYSESLQALTSSAENQLYTYDKALNGYAAHLTADQAETLRQSKGVLAVYEDMVYNLHTTRTPEFLGLNNLGPWADHGPYDLCNASQNVIIGVLDTGVWPESKSFNDKGMGPIPTKWKGTCDEAKDFNPKTNCNNKLIGARVFLEAYNKEMLENNMSAVVSPRDTDGHGTHTASTAAGATVRNASLYGYASGNARGMALCARVATYLVCAEFGCMGSDILGAMNQAIKDGVDVLSMSLGGGAVPYYADPVAIGAFAAMKKGIVVSCSAGNGGPVRQSVSNVAPWIMTVGAGTIDRDFPAYATLGNSKKFKGESLYSGEGMGKNPVELVYNSSTNGSRLCIDGYLSPDAVKGKVVLCDRGVSARVEKGAVVKAAGGVGMILANTAENGEELVGDSHLLPAVAVGMKAGDQIKNYVNKTEKPTAVLSFGRTVVNVKPSPVVAAFSSRGPNNVTQEILKPDLIGPGVNILAGWSGVTAPTGLVNDTRRVEFNIISGTSMSCPHISGLAALLKAAHPDWSPSAIKSALMTTTYTVDNTNSPLLDATNNSLSTPYASGSGYVNIRKALYPGLVYEITPTEYVYFVCSLKYTDKDFNLITGSQKNVTCKGKFENPGQLNYPSFSVLFNNETKAVVHSRVLTNVGCAGSIYTVSVDMPWNVKVTVKPKKLVFKNVGDRKMYNVTFEPKSSTKGMEAFGSIIWKNELHEVRSPVAFA